MTVRSLPTVVAVLGLGVALAACGTSTGSPAANPAASPVVSPAASEAARGSPVVPPASETAEPSVDRHGVPELEALLPSRVGGVELERLSLTGPDFYALGTDDSRSQLDGLLKNLGKAVGDLSVGDAGDPTGRNVIEIGVFRVAGAQPARLLAEWVGARQVAGKGVTVTTASVAGRSVTKIVDPGHPVGGVVYAFAKDDTIFLVQADDPAFVTDALGQLPSP